MAVLPVVFLDAGICGRVFRVFSFRLCNLAFDTTPVARSQCDPHVVGKATPGYHYCRCCELPRCFRFPREEVLNPRLPAFVKQPVIVLTFDLGLSCPNAHPA